MLALALAAASLLPPAPRDLPDRLVYVAANLAVPKNIDDLESLMARAHAAGATGLLLADSKFSRLEDMPKSYFANCDRVKAAAAKHHLEIIPAVFPIGYSNDILSRDPNLAEALPVRDALFTIKNGAPLFTPEGAPSLPPLADLKRWGFHDDCIRQDGPAATATDPEGANARVTCKLKLTPFRQYHVSVAVRTKDFKGTPEIKVLAASPTGKGEPASLIFSNLGVKPTQDWTIHHAVFNSLNHTEATLYLGAWGADSGTLSWKDAALDEVALTNLVRRPGAPLKVELEAPSGRTPLAEGADFEPVADPRMGNPPNLWPGEYDVWHSPPTLKLKKPLPDGARLRVSYHHVVTIYDGQVNICPSEPKTLELLREQARRVNDLWKPAAFWMSHDEIRCLNHDQACLARKLTPGQLLAENAAACVNILKGLNPDARIYAWSDMFDPHHNAVKRPYYLVNGDLTGSWEGLPKSVIIAAWYFDQRTDSLKFFADRGHPLLIAGYYDAPKPRVAPQLTDWLHAVPPAATLRGVMYTTWQHNYTSLEDFFQAAR